MKREQRIVYQELCKIIKWPLCGFCHYEAVLGSPCNGEAECVHPLRESIDPDGMMRWPGEDCWGFRPKLSVVDIADIVGLVLSEGFDSDTASWARVGDDLIVYGEPGK